MPTIELLNLTSGMMPGPGYHCSTLPGVRLRKPVRFLFQDIWTSIDEETGEIVAGTESPETTWDGDACKMANGGWSACASPRPPCSLGLDINSALPGQYLRHVTWFNDPLEMLLYLSAHELRHLWQFEHPKKISQIRQLLEIDDEADADFHALRLLSRYRQNSADFVESEPSPNFSNLMKINLTICGVRELPEQEGKRWTHVVSIWDASYLYDVPCREQVKSIARTLTAF